MPQDFAELLENLPAEALPVQPPRTLDERTRRWIELVLVLSVAFANSIFGSIQILVGARGSSNGAFDWVNLILHEVIALSLLGYLLYRRGIRFADLGLRWSFREFPRGMVLAIAFYLTYYAAALALQWIHRMFTTTGGGGLTAREAFGHATGAAIVLILINPFYEELIVRAYLMTEIKELTGSWTVAIVASVAVQTSYHLYYGWVGALALGTGFLIFSVYYARTRRATPLAVAHGIVDAVAMWRLF